MSARHTAHIRAEVPRRPRWRIQVSITPTGQLQVRVNPWLLRRWPTLLCFGALSEPCVPVGQVIRVELHSSPSPRWLGRPRIRFAGTTQGEDT